MINIILLAIQLTFSNGYLQPTDIWPPYVMPDAYPMGT